VKKHALVFGVVGGALIALLQLVQYRWLVVERSVEMYGAIVAALFAALGIWLGQRLTRAREAIALRDVAVPAAPAIARDEAKAAALGVTPRELEILELMAAGMSNREIAEKLFVSENTVKTHSSRLFEKLGAKRRTQAVQLGRRQALIP
jgi:two-component system, NarL family, response regulator LiaR